MAATPASSSPSRGQRGRRAPRQRHSSSSASRSRSTSRPTASPPAAPAYVGVARRDPDGTAVRLALVRKVTVNTMAAGREAVRRPPARQLGAACRPACRRRWSTSSPGARARRRRRRASRCSTRAPAPAAAGQGAARHPPELHALRVRTAGADPGRRRPRQGEADPRVRRAVALRSRSTSRRRCRRWSTLDRARHPDETAEVRFPSSARSTSAPSARTHNFVSTSSERGAADAGADGLVRAGRAARDLPA